MAILYFLLFSVYIIVVFYFCTRIDNKAYEKGINFPIPTIWKYAFYCMVWPVTMWFSKIWEL